ncbi:VanZ family protein [Vibrio variabilis]|uniref:VanZ family protein n=1 Tax=Vibrio variabilis TaxID=990271 RepID=UPI0013A6DB64|nr:VanZ family protein [Vibrio variabilis]
MLSLKPTPTNLIELDGFDKVQHAMAYFVLGLCATTIIKATRWRLVFTILWLLSGVVEVLQFMQPGRQGSIYDWLANGVGLLFAYSGACFIAKVMKNRDD